MTKQSSIRKQLITALTMLTIIPLTLLGVILAVFFYRTEYNETKAFQDLTTSIARQSIEFYIHEQETSLLSMIKTNNLLEMSSTEAYALLTRYSNALKSMHQGDVFDELALLDETGRETVRVSSTQVLTDKDLRDRSSTEGFILASESGRVYFSPVKFDPSTGEPHLSISIPIMDLNNSEAKGMLTAVVRLKFIWNEIADIKMCEGCVAYLIDENKRIIAHPDPSITLRQTYFETPVENGTTLAKGLDGTTSLISMNSFTIGGQTFYTVTEAPVLSVLSHPIYSLVTILAFMALSLTSAMAIGLVLIRRIIKPIESLADTVHKISQGDKDLKAEVLGNDEISALAASFNDMTTRLFDTINSLSSEKEKLRTYLNTSAVMVVIISADGTVTHINHKGCEVLGYEEDEIIGKDWINTFVPEPYRAKCTKTLSQLMSGDFEDVMTHEGIIQRVNGEQRHIAWYNAVLKDESGIITATLNSGIDITERKLAEKKVDEQNKLITGTIESLTHPFFVIDVKDYTVRIANSACNFGKLTEQSTCHSLTHNIDHPCDGTDHPCTIKEIIKTRKPVVLEHIHYDAASKPVFFEVYGYPIFDSRGDVIRVIEYNIDITERKKLESQLLQSQKMESVGRLAGGVAHDFNNLLTAILGYGELILDSLPEDSPVRENIEIMKDAGEKAAVLTNQLLAFSRKQVLEMRVISINNVLDNILNIIKRVIGEDIKLEVSARSRARIKADPAQIDQVLLNLAVNARDAMPDGGLMTIETADVELDKEYAHTHPNVEPGMYSMIAVSDNGKGMNKEVQENIFEPFFTTKGQQGTGLGLSTVYGIVKQHNGHIFVYSEQDNGTIFKVYLPATTEIGREDTPDEGSREFAGTETILVVDDEPSIRMLVNDTLQPHGYNILEAASANEAQDICRASQGMIDLILTDVIMPGMSSQDLADAVEAICPQTKILFMSGYTDNVVAKHGMLSAGVNYIQKPLTPSRLIRKIRSIIDSKPGA